MNVKIDLYSDKEGEIEKFLKLFYNNINIDFKTLKWEKSFENPVEMSDIIGTFIDNNDKFKINIWLSFDKDVYINVTENNANKIIKYIFERFPY